MGEPKKATGTCPGEESGKPATHYSEVPRQVLWLTEEQVSERFPDTCTSEYELRQGPPPSSNKSSGRTHSVSSAEAPSSALSLSDPPGLIMEERPILRVGLC